MSLDIIDGLSAAKTLKTSLDGPDHVPHHIAKGAVADNAAETESPIPVAGKAVTSASYSPAYTDGDRATLAVDKATGGILAHTRQLALTTDLVGAGGTVAHDAADDNYPISIGGRAIVSESGPTPVVLADRVNAWFDTFGRQIVKVGGRDIYAPFSSAARTATVSSSTYTHKHIKGLLIWLKVTAITSTPSIVLTIEGQNPVDGSWATFHTFNAVTSVSHNVFKVYPGIAATAGVDINGPMPAIYRFVVTHANANSITYSVGFEIAV